MLEKLTKKQTLLYNFVKDFIINNGFSPSYREIAEAFNYRSTATVAQHIDNLILVGALRKNSKTARSLELVSNETQQTVLTIAEQIKIRLKQLDESEFRAVSVAFKILNIDELNELI